MNLLSWLNTDTFETYRDKVNAIVSGVKEGGDGQLLIAAGAGNNPAWSDMWEGWIVVGSGGGAPAYGANFGNADGGIKFRRSLILDQVQIIGNITRTSAPIADGSSAVMFTLPSGYRPILQTNGGTVRHGSNNKIMGTLIDESTGEVYVTNNTGGAFGSYGNVNIIFPLT